MDDITIGDPVASVASDIKVIKDAGSAKGMHPNVTKYKLISDDMPLSIAPMVQFIHVKPDDATLLEALFLIGKVLDIAFKKYTGVKRALEHLQLIISHGALVLLKSLCISPRLMHILR